LLHALFYSGARRAEVVSLNRQDVQEGWAHEALIVGKGDKERNVFFDEETQGAMGAYLQAATMPWSRCGSATTTIVAPIRARGASLRSPSGALSETTAA
jgi:site-specific recombinase XerD